MSTQVSREDSIDGYSNAIVDTVMRMRETLLPIPSKLHYIFNLRGVVRVPKGMLMMPASLITNESMLLRLWHHEMMREYHDKFNSAEDRKWFLDQLKELSNILEDVIQVSVSKWFQSFQ